MHIVRLDIILENITALHIGSGKLGRISDMGVVTTPLGEPFLPGSSLKGKLRTTAERLAPHLGLEACLMGAEPDVECYSNLTWAQKHKELLESIRFEKEPQTKKDRLDEVTCDVCRIFGSPLMASRLTISDGMVLEWDEIIQVRDGVVIDRDSETVVPRLRFDYEVVPPGALFQFSLELTDLDQAELALVGAALLHWQDNLLLGGGTSRGLGRMKFRQVEAAQVDLSNPHKRLTYLLHQKMTPISDWVAYFQRYIDEQLQEVGSLA